MTLSGRVAIITGAGSSGPGVGTGKAISVLYARNGASVVLVDKYNERARETQALIEADGGQALIVEADLREPTTPDRVVAETVTAFGRVDILVNNAAIASPVGILDTTLELYHEIVDVNLTAPFMMSKAVIPVMTGGGGGVILNISSIASMRGVGRSQTAYAATKAGLIGMTVDLADAFGIHGVRVNTIAPGIINTPMRDGFAQQGGRDPAKSDRSDRTALGREGNAWDIAAAALFLASDEGSYITGHLLPVDGGATARSH